MSAKTRRIPDFIWRWMRPFNQRVTRIYDDKFKARGLVLLLTTRGRKSGLARVTPLQFEEIDGLYYVASARGAKADWFRNILADPHVEVQIQDRRFSALAEAISDPARIADFLEVRLQRRPRMIGIMLRAEGLPAGAGRAELEEFAATKTLVALRPVA
ncbi:MAG: nitroreductase family deazaflavin-dependent oxidoreductase [Anaerolineales bacterium]|nr:nitroreductase family deazaflavin-dependent oxidoreductase [Anaerolineales bacterium]